jgi:glycosidase
MTLSQDFLYSDPLRNCIFLDNHDMDRVYSVVDEDPARLKMGLTWLLTLRGIPQLYYGTEVLMKNKKTHTDATVREDFPGGWKEDKSNRFTASGRTSDENDMFSFVSRLAGFRKTSSALTTGKTMQYIPVDGVYTYFRYDNRQTVMVIVNTGSKPVKPDWNKFRERAAGYSQGKDVISGRILALKDVEIKPKESYVLEMLK